MGVLLKALMGAKRIQAPGAVQVIRPGETRRKKVETDPAVIAAFFRKHVNS